MSGFPFQAIKIEGKVECRCHGMSGACATKTCTRVLPKFRQVGDHLMKKYHSAVPVMADNNGNKLIPRETTIAKHTKKDIVYSESSPEFCKRDIKVGSLGTHARKCDKDSKGPDGCEVLCCNRGYRKVVKTVITNCECIFKYCCDVTCKKCQTKKVSYVCN